MAAPKFTVTFGNSVVIAGAAASASAAVPANTELLAITVSTPMCFRVGVGAQTAVVTDPMLTPGAPPYVIKINSDQSYNIAGIWATGNTTAGNLSAFVVQEA